MEKLVHLLVEGRDRLPFVQILVVAAASTDDAVVRARAFLIRHDARLVDIDSEETGEVELSVIPAGWMLSARSPEGVVAAAGRIYSTEGQEQ